MHICDYRRIRINWEGNKKKMNGVEEEKAGSAFSTCERVKSDSELIEDVVGSVSVLGQAALSYAANGLPVFPLHYIDESGARKTTVVVGA